MNFDQFPRFKHEQLTIVFMVTQWARAYGVPVEAIERQIGFAHTWCDSNKKRAPKVNVMRFLNNWMMKADSFGNLKVQQPAPRPAEAIPEGDMTIEQMIEIRQRNFPQNRIKEAEKNV